MNPENWFELNDNKIDTKHIEALLEKRNQAKTQKNYQIADDIRSKLSSMGITIKDTVNGTIWEKTN